mgnify:CR=1 FL=1
MLAVAAGFEPAVGDYPTLAFEASTFGRSDTPPKGHPMSLCAGNQKTQIADQRSLKLALPR